VTAPCPLQADLDLLVAGQNSGRSPTSLAPGALLRAIAHSTYSPPETIEVRGVLVGARLLSNANRSNNLSSRMEFAPRWVPQLLVVRPLKLLAS
jgi:hypothetical protein